MQPARYIYTLVEAVVLQAGTNGPAPGVLSSEEKISKDLSSSEDNLEKSTYFWPTQEGADEYVQRTYPVADRRHEMMSFACSNVYMLSQADAVAAIV